MLLGIVLHGSLPYFSRMVGFESIWPSAGRPDGLETSAHYLTWHLCFRHAYLLRQPHFRSALDTPYHDAHRILFANWPGQNLAFFNRPFAPPLAD